MNRYYQNKMRKKLLYIIMFVAGIISVKNVQAEALTQQQIIYFNGIKDGTKYDIVDLEYPEKAKGWRNGQYYKRKLVRKENGHNISINNGKLEAKSRMWKESFEQSLKSIYYYDTGALSWDVDNQDYDINVTFENPTNKKYRVFIRANEMLQSDIVTVKPGENVTIKCCVSVVYSKLELSFIVPQSAKAMEKAEWKTVYINKIAINKMKKEKAGRIPTIFISGDSISATRSAYYTPCEGWGQELYRYIQHSGRVSVSKHDEPEYSDGWYEYVMNTAIIENRATCGDTAALCRESGKFDSILNKIRPGDCVIVQFGTNDAKKAEGKNTHVEQFKNHLQYFIDGCKQRGATCILASSIPKCKFNKSGKVVSTAIPYRRAMRDITKHNNSPYLNIGGIMDELVTTLGKDSAKDLYMILDKGIYPAYPQGDKDRIHVNYKGARKIAQMIAGEISKQRKLKKISGLIKCNTNYYEGLSTIRDIQKIKVLKKEKKVKLSWKKVKHAKVYVLLRYNKKKKQYIAIGKTTKNMYTIKNYHKTDKYKIEVRF